MLLEHPPMSRSRGRGAPVPSRPVGSRCRPCRSCRGSRTSCPGTRPEASQAPASRSSAGRCDRGSAPRARPATARHPRPGALASAPGARPHRRAARRPARSARGHAPLPRSARPAPRRGWPGLQRSGSASAPPPTARASRLAPGRAGGGAAQTLGLGPRLLGQRPLLCSRARSAAASASSVHAVSGPFSSAGAMAAARSWYSRARCSAAAARPVRRDARPVISPEGPGPSPRARPRAHLVLGPQLGELCRRPFGSHRSAAAPFPPPRPLSSCSSALRSAAIARSPSACSRARSASCRSW